MKPSISSVTALLLISPTILALAGSVPNEPKPGAQPKVTIADGLHLWYEIKSDPEDSAKLIVCGTKWDALANTPFGFLYFSADRGQTWRNVLEDRSSTWVTEHSCAYGPHHRAYFISEAGKEIEGGASAELGTTRLFLSTDSGNHWLEVLKTGWADHSTSATSATSARLYTFFHAARTARDNAKQKGNDLGVLVFTPDGSRVVGPYFGSGTRDQGYSGIYPSEATSLRSGAVVALFYASRQTSQGTVADLGVARADQSDEPVVTLSVIAHPQMDSSGRCVNFFNGSMAYDEAHNKLFVAYTDGCNGSDRLILTTSADEGKTWTVGTALRIPKDVGRIESPSLVVVSKVLLGLLWKDKPTSSSWFFSYIRDGSVLATPTCLTDSSTKPAIGNDSLWTEIIQSNRVGGSVDFPSEGSITLNVRTLLNAVWRSKGVLMTGGRVAAIWSSGADDGMRLYYESISSETLAGPDQWTQASISEEDVSRNVQLLYGGDRDQVGQYFDEATGTLKICTTIRNLGHHPIEPPIEFRVDDLNSTWGAVSALNSSNHLPGAGAIFDVSGALTGSQIPPGSTSNPFCMSFRLRMEPTTLPAIPVDLLSVKLRVFARYPDRDKSSCNHSN